MTLDRESVSSHNRCMFDVLPSLRSVGAGFMLGIACILVPAIAYVVTVAALVALVVTFGVAVWRPVVELASSLWSAFVHAQEWRRDAQP
jgi:hypothetical protein